MSGLLLSRSVGAICMLNHVLATFELRHWSNRTQLLLRKCYVKNVNTQYQLRTKEGMITAVSYGHDVEAFYPKFLGSGPLI